MFPLNHSGHFQKWMGPTPPTISAISAKPTCWKTIQCGDVNMSGDVNLPRGQLRSTGGYRKKDPPMVGQKRAETYRCSHSYEQWWPIKRDDLKWFTGWLSIDMRNNHKVHNYIPLICCSHPGKFACWEVPKSVSWLILIPGLYMFVLYL
jgi:hypothetical protein